MNHTHNSYFGNIYTRLSEYIAKLDKGNVDYYIGMAMLSKLKNFPDIYIDEIACLAHTTKSSVAKFCRKIGYASFSDLKNDIEYYEVRSLVARFNTNTFTSVDDYWRKWSDMQYSLSESLIHSINHDVIKKAAESLRNAKSALFLAADYNMNIVSKLGELLFIHDVILTVINRDNSDYEIQKAARNTDVVMVSCLSGDWLKNRKALIDSLDCPFYAITTDSSVEGNAIKPNHRISFPLYGSFFETQMYLEIIFLLLNYYMIQEIKTDSI